MDRDIVIVEQKKVDLSNALVVVGFPTVGLVSTIAANYVVTSLGLERIGAVYSNLFPPATVVHEATPMPPVRIYASKIACGPGGSCEELVVILSEFNPQPNLVKPLADAIIDWCSTKAGKCRLIVTLEGIPMDGGPREDLRTFGLGSTSKARDILKEYGIEQLQEGVVSGLSGVLLYEGERRGIDVTCLLAEASPTYPNARAAAKVLELLDKIIPALHIDPQPLYLEAEKIEAQIKSHLEKARPVIQPFPESPPPGIYR